MGISEIVFGNNEMKKMKIDAYLTPLFPEKNNLFEGSVVIMIDVLRASTTICAALENDAKEVIPCESLDKAVSIYSSLDRNVRFLGGERNCTAPSGFDAGNSPDEYTREKVEGKTVILTTSNGTRIFTKAREAAHRFIGSFVNIDILSNHIRKIFSEENEFQNIVIMCAGTNNRLAYEDVLCGGAFVSMIQANFPEAALTDTADAAKNLFRLHSSDMVKFLKEREHASALIEMGFEKDVETALSFNSYPVLPFVDGSSIKKL